eukprot:scaffold1215_cov67-Isochrysis_galbana.AAC.1
MACGDVSSAGTALGAVAAAAHESARPSPPAVSSATEPGSGVEAMEVGETGAGSRAAGCSVPGVADAAPTTLAAGAAPAVALGASAVRPAVWCGPPPAFSAAPAAADEAESWLGGETKASPLASAVGSAAASEGGGTSMASPPIPGGRAAAAVG